LPNDAELTVLTDYLGGNKLAGNKLKSTSGWNNNDSGATNSTGFTALPGGCHNFIWGFIGIGISGNWWSSAEGNKSSALSWNILSDNNHFNKGYSKKTDLFSVRCIKD
jgi:uncharacterized protein (TIGR02145 family)